MKCPNCEKEYSDPNQLICEFCGTELVQSTELTKTSSPLHQFLEDSGIKGLFKKIKDNLKNI